VSVQSNRENTDLSTEWRKGDRFRDGSQGDRSVQMAHMEGAINLETMFLKNGYRLGDKLGKGSFAVVRKAMQLSNRRELAVKIVDNNLATKDFLEKFLARELNIIVGLKHPNIIDVEKVGRTALNY